MIRRAWDAGEQYRCRINRRPEVTAPKSTKLKLNNKFDKKCIFESIAGVYNYVVQSTLPNIYESGTPSGLRDPFNELVDGRVSILKNSEEYRTESKKADMYILIWLMKLNSVQFSARLNIKMTQNKLFEIFEWDTEKNRKPNLSLKMASTTHLDESATWKTYRLI